MPLEAHAQNTSDSKASASSTSSEYSSSPGAGGLWFQGGYGFGSSPNGSFEDIGYEWSGYGVGYPTDWLRLGGFGQRVGLNTEQNDVSTALEFGGGGVLVGYEAQIGDMFYVATDLGIGAGALSERREFQNAEVPSIQADNLTVSSEDTNFGMAYTVGAQFGLQFSQWARVGLRMGGTYATDYGDRSVIVPSGGIDFSFGAFPK